MIILVESINITSVLNFFKKVNKILVNKEQLMEAIDRFKSGLIAKATDGDMSEREYKELTKITSSN